MGVSAVRVRADAARARVARVPAEHRKEVHGPEVRGPAARALRQRGPARERLPQNSAPPRLRQVPRSARLHPQTDRSLLS